MARRKKPDNESKQETQIRRQLEIVSDHATRNEKVAWERKMDNMVSLMATLKPIEDQISDLLAQKAPIIDGITNLRAEMVKDCIHPYTQLIHKGNCIECKFCMTKLSVPSVRHD